ncbi:ABC transporter ATP-binding protein [Arthrobacter sp. 2MCAF15]|uniref:ABC transporter ATP-binding protein n=1 Tax=Arthrobacter sp. 2MCAF15 TaxID=3232984 RepID=UPI003F8E254A
MLCVQQLSVTGRRDDLLPATSLEAARGELLLVEGVRQDQRTALALALSGRMRPSSGIVNWDGNARIKVLRQASSVVDSPGVNEPEQHLSVRDLVTEDLALVPRRHRGALRSTPWLTLNKFDDIAGLWTEQLPAARRTGLLTALALANPDTELLVVDSPDRHSGDVDDWLPRLQELAHDAGRPLAVVATVTRIPDGWTGPAAVIGNAVAKPEPHPGDSSETLLPESLLPETEDAK